MKRVAHIVQVVSDIVSGQFAGWLIFILMCTVLVEVLTRYILRSPLIIADETGAYILVAIIFMGLAYTWKERGHVRIRFLVDKLPIKVRNWLRLITLIMAIAVVPVLIYGSYDLVEYSLSHGVRSSTWLRVPLAWPQMFLIIGSILLFLQMIVGLVKAAKGIRTTGARPDES